MLTSANHDLAEGSIFSKVDKWKHDPADQLLLM